MHATIYSITAVIAFFLLSTSIQATDYYWVGGSGDWSDISHWATTSGGRVTHNQAPTAVDNVFFDENSFTEDGQQVVFNTGIAFCNNMSWEGVTNTPTLIGNDNLTLTIYGALVLSPNMTFDFNGAIIFAANIPGNTIDFSTHAAGRAITFSGTGGWRLSSPLILDGVLTFSQGNLNTNGRPVTCNYFNSSASNERTLTLGASTITVQGGSMGNSNAGSVPLHLNANNLTMEAGTSTFLFTASTVDIWLQGSGTINFNRVVLNNPVGSSRITLRLPQENAEATEVNYRELDLAHETLLSGSPNINKLKLYPNQRYTFEGGETFSINDIDAVGDCTAGVTIMSSTPSDPAFFQFINDISVDFVTLQAIHALGDGKFLANNVIDLGNNEGWDISLRIPETYYWIRGTGDWDDPVHWSKSSGGNSSGCIPSIIDDVFFDANSFNNPDQVVTINVKDAYCNYMNWTGASNDPQLAGSAENAMHIGGSLRFIPGMQHNFAGNYFFESNQSGNNIYAAGQLFNLDLYFIGEMGEWTLRDSLFVNNTINFNSGTLRTNGQKVNCNAFISVTDLSRVLLLSNSYIYINNRNNPGEWNISTTNFTLDAGTSTIESAGSTSNSFKHTGSDTLSYNNILFSAYEGRLINDIDASPPEVTIDSLTFLREGSVSGNHNVNYWKMSPGYRYYFETDATQIINELDANGTCAEGVISIRASHTNYSSNFNINTDHNFERLQIQGIHQTGTGQLIAENSIDEGDNQNWIINNASPRTLYWVGDTGDWHDPSHWSLISGGAGGECIPTSIDDVIIDGNAFSANSPEITSLSNKESYCHDITWTAEVPADARFNILQLNIYGSILLEQPVEWLVGTTQFRGAEEETITSTGSFLGQVIFNGKGRYTLQDEFRADLIRHLLGTIHTNDQKVTAMNYIANSLTNPRQLILGNSEILLTGENENNNILTFTVTGEGLEIIPGNAQIEFSNEKTGIRLDYPLELHDVIFSNPNSTARVNSAEGSFHSITFFGNGLLYGLNATDSLICAAGKSYQFESDATQTINKYWQIIGNNCTPIELSATSIGNLANVSMPASSRILADFVQMRDINASGGANFLAGVHSTDIANSNVGWLFETAPEFIEVGFLGTDRAICSGEPVNLNAYNYSTGETYRWQDGSTDSIYVATQPGIYSVAVTFSNNCMIEDEVEVIAGQDFQANLPEETQLCEGESLVLDSSIPLNGVTYLWQDGSTADTLSVSKPDTYQVVMTLGECSVTDSVKVNFFPNLTYQWDETVTACQGDTVIVEVPAVINDFAWNDGSNDDAKNITEPGVYILNGSDDNGCTVRDSIKVNYLPAPDLDLGQDTTVCDDQPFLVVPEKGAGELIWYDGSNASEYVAETSGIIFATLEQNGCTASDSIFVEFRECALFKAYLPNVFSPNGDGVNDEFAPLFNGNIEVLNYDMQIFDRWGNQVFSSRQLENSWTGNFQGQQLKSGVYLYFIDIEYRDDKGESEAFFKGDISLVR